jgi:type IV pilus assembly protein PilA
MSPPLTPARTPWLRMVKVTARLTLVVPAIWVLVGCIDLFPVGLLFAAAFVWFCKWLLSHLDRKEGLTGAVGVGVATICLIVVFSQMLTPGQDEMNGWERVIVGLLFLLPAALIASAIKAYWGMGSARGNGWAWMAGLGWGVVYFLIVFLSFGSYSATLQRSGQAANQASAVNSIRDINTCAAAYRLRHPEQGYPPRLATLGPAGEQCIDGRLATGRKSGYRFTYSPGAAGEKVHIETYTLTARPAKHGATGMQSYYSDQTQLIRTTLEDRPATITDPPLP